jgi:CheY-like chemotaxis protein
LEVAGFETEIIHDGSQALTRLAEITPAVVVMDLHLPLFYLTRHIEINR